MKITSDRETLQTCWQIASAVVPSRSPKPILQSLKIDVSADSAVLNSTDLEISIRVPVPDVQIHETGAAMLPVARVGLILRELKDPIVTIETTDNHVIIKGERSEFKLTSEDPADFPQLGGMAQEKYHEVAASCLNQLIHRTIFATDSESSRYALGGVCFELADDAITAVATDGRRLARVVGKAHAVAGHSAGDQQSIIPARALGLVERSLSATDKPVKLTLLGNRAVIDAGTFVLETRLVEGRFPRWRDVFPKRTDAVRVDAVAGMLYSVVRQAQIATNEESRGVDFTFHDGRLVLSGRAANVGQSRVELPLAYDGPSLKVTLDPRYVGDFLKVLDPSSNVTLDLEEGEGAVVLSTQDGYGYVVMPLSRDT